MSQLTHTISYKTEVALLVIQDISWILDLDGQGLGINDDGKVTFEEVQTTVGECPGDFGMVYNQTTREHNWAQQRVVEMGGVLYFMADDGDSGWELWRSDGTVSGSYIVKDIRGGVWLFRMQRRVRMRSHVPTLAPYGIELMMEFLCLRRLLQEMKKYSSRHIISGETIHGRIC